MTITLIPLQGEEWGASTPFQYFTDHDDHELGRAVREGRRASSPVSAGHLRQSLTVERGPLIVACHLAGRVQRVPLVHFQ
jgi:1,4-alpha-glucan branching enzyme